MSTLKVFLSYARDDVASATRLRDELARHKEIDVWIDNRNLFAGDDWKRAISDRLDESDAVIILLSQRAVSKTGYVQMEIREAIQRALLRPPGRRFLIPVRLDDCSS